MCEGAIEIKESTVKWIMKRNGIPEFLEEFFKTMIESELNQTNILDSIFYRHKKVIVDIAEAQGYKIIPCSYEELKEDEPDNSETEET